MTPENQRIAIAKAAGMTDTSIESVQGKLMYGQIEIPDYLNSLDAMHEAEKVLTERQRSEYEWWVGEMVGEHQMPHCCLGAGKMFVFIHATATERAEAFLKALNLWKDED